MKFFDFSITNLLYNSFPVHSDTDYIQRAHSKTLSMVWRNGLSQQCAKEAITPLPRKFKISLLGIIILASAEAYTDSPLLKR